MRAGDDSKKLIDSAWPIKFNVLGIYNNNMGRAGAHAARAHRLILLEKVDQVGRHVYCYRSRAH